MPDLDLSEGRRLLEAATSGPWLHHSAEAATVLTGLERAVVFDNYRPRDAALIVWMHAHLPALLDTAAKTARIEALLAEWGSGKFSDRHYGAHQALTTVRAILRGDQQ